jgi:hypothetical protein
MIPLTQTGAFMAGLGWRARARPTFAWLMRRAGLSIAMRPGFGVGRASCAETFYRPRYGLGFVRTGTAMRSVRVAVVVTCLLTNCSHEAPGTIGRTGAASALSVEAAALFRQFCLDAPPVLNTIDRRATDSRFQVFMDRPIAPGARQKNWLVPRASGGPPMMLSVESGPSFDGTENVTVCGVLAMGASGVGLQHALAADPRLGPSDRVSPRPEGGTVVVWSARVGGARAADGTKVMLAYDVPGLPAPFVNLTFKRQQ